MTTLPRRRTQHTRITTTELHPEVHLLDRYKIIGSSSCSSACSSSGGRAPGDAMRWQLAYPGSDAGGGILPRAWRRAGHSAGVLHPAGHDARHVHGVLRHHAAARGCVRELPDPAQIGTHDMAFPRINMCRSGRSSRPGS